MPFTGSCRRRRNSARPSSDMYRGRSFLVVLPKRSARCRSSPPPHLASFVSFLLPGCFNERNSEMKKLLLTCALATLALPLWAKTDAISLIPTDAVTVGVVRLAEMRSSPLSSALFQQTDKVSTNGDAAVF